jgi:type VI secretion system protein ImpL
MLLGILRKTLAPFGLLLAIVVALIMARSRFRFLHFVTTEMLVLAIVALVAVWLLVVLIRWFVERRRAAAIEDGILEQARAGADQATPARRVEIEELNRNLTEALALLKKGPQGNKALYTLPWYLIIGPPAIGKTTAIKNSGLNFPGMTTAKLMRGTGGTRNCDWWFSSDAILLDTAGRYADGADRSETEDEWFSFLDLLKTHRKKRPIDGLILAYSIEDLHGLDEMGVINAARELRQRMDEILDRLGWTYPVYVLLTKCDLIAGFKEYFASLTPGERYQVWGAVYDPKPEGDQEAATRFGAEFDGLVSNLRTIRPARMADVSRSEDWGRIFMFPEEFASLRSKLVLMVETLFEANPYRKDVPIFRGTYFSSGKQLGRPFDLVAREIQEMLGAGAGYDDVEEQEEKDDAYFVRDLFAKVLKTDQGLVRMTGAAARQRVRFSLAVAAGALLLGVLASLWIGFSWARLQARMKSTRDIAVNVQQLDSRGTPTEELRKLGDLRRRVEGSWRSFPLLVKGDVHETARDVYHRAFTERILKPVEEDVAAELRSAGSVDANAVRRALRVELMLLEPAARKQVGWSAAELTDGLSHYGLDVVAEDERAHDQLEAALKVFLDLGKPIPVSYTHLTLPTTPYV